MSKAPLSLLLCTNGIKSGQAALEYGVWLAELLGWPVVLLGVVEQPENRFAVDELVQFTAQRLEQKNIACQIQIEAGEPSQVIAQWAHRGEFITVFGPLGRPAWRRFVQGRSFRHLMAAIENPLLYVPRLRLPLRRILLCLGGLEYGLGVQRLSIYLAKKAGAQVTVLHVVEPVTLDYPIARQVMENWEKILQTETPQGRNLRQAMKAIEQAGLSLDFKVLHGSPVTEILNEARRGDYDLIGLGSPYSAHALRHLYLPNVTAEVAETAGLPVLSVRLDRELIGE
ncbi:MAG: universal stress protein [Anaerolineales bacterium]|nr:universal stress protein [Anaerolineales bacterium]